MTAARVYYSENDKFCVSWLRELMKAGAIAEGDIDDRSIKDVQADDVRGYDRCHFFAGIGIWEYALAAAQWPDDRTVWTGSCPCQPFSAAGQRKGFADDRHLWPDWFRLIRVARPVAILGEQVASALGWFDLVSGDLEGEGYTVGAAIVGAHSVGAPHIRQRIYWVAESAASRRPEARQHGSGPSLFPARPAERGRDGSLVVATQQQVGLPGRARESRSADCGMAESESQRNGHRNAGRWGSKSPDSGELGLSRSPRLPQRISDERIQHETVESQERQATKFASRTSFWSECAWLPCIDGKMRPTERTFQRMANGTAADLGYVRDGDSFVLSPLIQKSKHRVGRLRGYGNALVAPLAIEFVKAVMETI